MITSLDVPWMDTPPEAPAAAPITGVDVLPGYSPEETATAPITLDQPWSEGFEVRPQPSIASLDDLLRS